MKQRQKQEIEMERNVTRTRSLETGTADRAQDEPTDNENQKPSRKTFFAAFHFMVLPFSVILMLSLVSKLS
jgi:hypothetical protein